MQIKFAMQKLFTIVKGNNNPLKVSAMNSLTNQQGILLFNLLSKKQNQCGFDIVSEMMPGEATLDPDSIFCAAVSDCDKELEAEIETLRTALVAFSMESFDPEFSDKKTQTLATLKSLRML
jgi:hypothetical protein